MRGVTILYEDSAGERSEFALHDLVLRCAADRLGREPRHIKDLIHGVPKKGNGNVWRACRQDLPRIARSGRAVFAVFDDDEVRTMTKLPIDACKTKVIAAIKKGCEPAEALRVVLIIENTESVLDALRAQGAIQGHDGMFADAIERKVLASRDILLKKAAWLLTPEQRENLIERVPTLGYLVSKLVTLLEEEPRC